jgi:hypothetical protein
VGTSDYTQRDFLKAAGLGAFSLELYREYLKQFSPPTGPFDPEDSWEHIYDVYPVYGKWGKWTEKHRGQCRIKRKVQSGEDTFRLEVSSEVTFLDFGYGNHPAKTQMTKANIRCANDDLATPQSWNLESVALGAEEKPRPLSQMSESGVFAEGTIKLTNTEGISRKIDVSRRLTCNWSLFDAVQRMHKKEPPTTNFEMLEDLRLPRANQRLTLDGQVEFELGGRKTRLYGFHQIGEGILPIHYWLDEQGRVLFALGGVRAYLWHSKGA